MRADLLPLAARLAESGEPFAFVTVVRREAPSSARVGDTALVTKSGDVHGWVGGGCTRSTLLREALRAIEDGEPRLLSLSPEPARDPRPGLVELPMTCKSGGTVELYFEPVLPAACLLVVGTTPAARALVRIGDAMGYRAIVVDPLAVAEGDAVLPEPATVVKSLSSADVPRGAHVLIARMDESDLDAIEAVAALEPAYVGVIASRKRFADLRATLQARGLAASFLDRIAAPAGLDLGARTPEEIALSVLAQIVANRRRPAAAIRTPEPMQVAVAARPRSGPGPAEAVDPVCGMTVAIAGARHFADVDGRRTYFCCGGCRQKFLADPASYAQSPAGAHGA
jgi:xanthine dehydrogenase accessory factor